ncbi:hypothetical protein BDN72DRAFT_863325 [Pluteus cervinus]|uniref:Uncharacterized protein n=1 Tax=Pluteus cervinus TaxID=181527 RepID=A0ACD3AAC8_9AGAR|nr:hypothetical protein BDN72DRAFT_863325 [Pluteus cervinus]
MTGEMVEGGRDGGRGEGKEGLEAKASRFEQSCDRSRIRSYSELGLGPRLCPGTWNILYKRMSKILICPLKHLEYLCVPSRARSPHLPSPTPRLSHPACARVARTLASRIFLSFLPSLSFNVPRLLLLFTTPIAFDLLWKVELRRATLPAPWPTCLQQRRAHGVTTQRTRRPPTHQPQHAEVVTTSDARLTSMKLSPSHDGVTFNASPLVFSGTSVAEHYYHSDNALLYPDADEENSNDSDDDSNDMVASRRLTYPSADADEVHVRQLSRWVIDEDDDPSKHSHHPMPYARHLVHFACPVIPRI